MKKIKVINSNQNQKKDGDGENLSSKFTVCSICSKLSSWWKKYVTNWEDIHPEFNSWSKKWWKGEGFSYEETKEWIKLGFEPNDYFAAKEWKETGFNYEQVKKWFILGMKPKDFAYCTYLWDLKNNEEKYQKYLIEVAENSKLSEEAIKQIKDFNHKKLTLQQESLLEQLISNEELRKRYKVNGLCFKCQQPNFARYWCQPCNCQLLQQNSWTSSNQEVDKCIKEQQSKATSWTQVLEWIPFDRFTNIEYLAKGGFSVVYKAQWIDGLIVKWDDRNKKWVREKDYEYRGLKTKNYKSYKSVVLKSLYNSQNITTDFLQEITNHNLVGFSCNFVRCYGVSQDPETKNYLMVMDYKESGDLRQYLQDNYSELRFNDKLSQLRNVARGLNYVHEQNLVHHDFHAGNILVSNNGTNNFFITDLGLCRLASEKNDDKIYGVLPYIAPEVLWGKSYTQASDIYSFGMVAYEMFCGFPPYHEFAHDYPLAIKIMQGLRPNLDNIQVPQLLKNLINRCWDANPTQRQTAEELKMILDDHLNKVWDILDKEDTEFYKQYKELQDAGVFDRLGKCIISSLTSNNQTHSQVIYTSRLLDFKNLPKPQNSKEINEQFWGSKRNNISQSVELPMTELHETLEEEKNQKIQAQIQIPPKRS